MPLKDQVESMQGMANIAALRQQISERRQEAQNRKIASESLRGFYQSQKEGNPNYELLQNAIINSPEMSNNMLAALKIQNAEQARDAADYAVKAPSVLGNRDAFLRLSADRINRISARGGDPSDTQALVSAYESGDIEGTRNMLKSASAALVNQGYIDKNVYGSLYGGLTGNSEIEAFNQLTKGFSATDVAKAKRIKLGLDPRAVGSSDVTIAQEGLTDLVGDSKSRISGQVKGAESTAKGESDRKQDFINRGVAAAEGVPVVKRAITLLDSVGTGGFDKVALQAKQAFGIESADEGELSYNLGKSVLSQLRETFGAAFTAAEGERLQKLEAGLGRNPATNKRILKQAEAMMLAKAKRGRKAAEESGDDFTVSDIDSFLNMSLDPSNQGGSGKGVNTGGIIDVNDLVNKYAD